MTMKRHVFPANRLGTLRRRVSHMFYVDAFRAMLAQHCRPMLAVPLLLPFPRLSRTRACPEPCKKTRCNMLLLPMHTLTSAHDGRKVPLS